MNKINKPKYRKCLIYGIVAECGLMLTVNVWPWLTHNWTYFCRLKTVDCRQEYKFKKECLAKAWLRGLRIITCLSVGDSNHTLLLLSVLELETDLPACVVSHRGWQVRMRNIFCWTRRFHLQLFRFVCNMEELQPTVLSKSALHQQCLTKTSTK
jgi:hypothetical protein